MCVCYRNYYKISREHSYLTQEVAAELLSISPRSLSDYETGKTTPSDEVVEKMVEIYKTRLLGWWHLRSTSELAKKCLPDIQLPQTNADVYMQIDFSEDDLSKMKLIIKQIMSDGKITPDELEDYERMRVLAKKIAGKFMSIYTYEPEVTS